MQLSQSLLDQVRTLANEAGKHLTHFYQQNVTIQTKSDNTCHGSRFICQPISNRKTDRTFP